MKETISATKVDYSVNYLDLTQSEVDFVKQYVQTVDHEEIGGSLVYYMDNVALRSLLNDPELTGNEKMIAQSIIDKCQAKEGPDFAFDIIFA